MGVLHTSSFKITRRLVLIGLRLLDGSLPDRFHPTPYPPRSVKVTGRVEKAEALLGARVVDEPAATEAVSHARGEIAIARLSIRKAKEAVDRAEEEERCEAWPPLSTRFTSYKQRPFFLR